MPAGQQAQLGNPDRLHRLSGSGEKTWPWAAKNARSVAVFQFCVCAISDASMSHCIEQQCPGHREYPSFQTNCPSVLAHVVDELTSRPRA